MATARQFLESAANRKRWLVPGQVPAWAERFASVDAAYDACPFGHWLVVIAALKDVPEFRVVRAAAQVLRQCQVLEAAEGESEVRDALTELLAWGAQPSRSPWKAVPLVPGSGTCGPRHKAARTSVRFLAEATRILSKGGAAGPCLELMSSLSLAAVCGAGHETLFEMGPAASTHIEAAVCARVGLANAQPGYVIAGAPPTPTQPTGEVASVVDVLERVTSVAREHLGRPTP